MTDRKKIEEEIRAKVDAKIKARREQAEKDARTSDNKGPEPEPKQAGTTPEPSPKTDRAQAVRDEIRKSVEDKISTKRDSKKTAAPSPGSVQQIKTTDLPDIVEKDDGNESEVQKTEKTDRESTKTERKKKGRDRKEKSDSGINKAFTKQTNSKEDKQKAQVQRYLSDERAKIDRSQGKLVGAVHVMIVIVGISLIAAVVYFKFVAPNKGDDPNPDDREQGWEDSPNDIRTPTNKPVDVPELPQLERIMRRARTLADEGDFDGAIDLLDAHSLMHPEDEKECQKEIARLREM